MASITICNLDNDAKRYLRMRTSFFGASKEAEARVVLRGTMEQQPLEILMMTQLEAETAARRKPAGA